jgi:hypothetical protein
MTTITDTLEAELVAMAREHWARENKPAFLSTIGGRLSQTAKVQFRAAGVPLRKFVETSLQGRLRLVSLGDGGDLVLPIENAANLGDEEVTSLAGAQPVPGRSLKFPHFRREVWRAFSRPLGSTRRYLRISPDGVELLETDETPSGVVQVVAGDLPSIDGYFGRPRAESVAEAIASWAAKNNIDVELLKDREYSPTLRSSSRLSSTRTEGATRLLDFLEILEPSELSRVSLPGDVLLSVLKRGTSR